MGQSTNGLLFYGYTWEDEIDLFDGEDYEDFLCLRAGLVSPWEEMPNYDIIQDYQTRREAENLWVADHRGEIDAFHEAQTALVDRFLPAELHSHCSCDYPIPYLSTFNMSAYRGSPQRVESMGTASDIVEWNEALDHWFEELEIEKPHPQAGFFLASMWC